MREGEFKRFLRTALDERKGGGEGAIRGGGGMMKKKKGSSRGRGQGEGIKASK